MEKDTFISFTITFITSMVALVIWVHQPSQKMVVKELPLNIIEIQSGYATDVKQVDGGERRPIRNDIKCESHAPCLALAEAIYYEARGESIGGQIAVGWVIINRKHSDRFPTQNTIREVISHKCHFSYRCDGSMKNGFTNKKAYTQSLFVAENILNGSFADPTNGADHYLNPKKVKVMPKWTKAYPLVASIGNHDFYAWQ